MNNAVKTVADALKKSSAENYGQADLTQKLVMQGLYKKEPATNTTMKKSEQNSVKVAEIRPKYMERENLSEEELQEKALEYADAAYRNRTEALNIADAKKLGALKNKLDTNNENEKKLYADAANERAKTVEKIADNAVKKGMVNSSVFTELNSAADREYAAKISAAATKYNRIADSIKAEIDMVNAQKALALQEYELKKASEYEKKLAELRRAEIAARNEVNEYNRQVADFMANYEEIVKKTQEEWRKALAGGN